MGKLLLLVFLGVAGLVCVFRGMVGILVLLSVWKKARMLFDLH